MKKKIVRSALAVLLVGVVAAVGFRVYIGAVAGDGEISREVQADRSFSGGGASDTGGSSEGSRESGTTAQGNDRAGLGIIQYGVTSGDGGESVARFLILETIFDRRNMVEGTTRQIDGGFLINYLDHTVRVGQFEINVRDIRTRSLDVDISSRGWTDGERDVVIRGQILESGRPQYEFATFDPVQVRGVPQAFGLGDTLDLVVTGDLTIKGETSRVSFDMELTLDSAERISGSAAATIRWADFGITVPYVGGGSDVDAVADTVELQLEFTAVEEARIGV